MLRAGAPRARHRTAGAVADAALLHAEALGAVRDGGTFVGLSSATPATPERGIDVTVMNVEPDGAKPVP